MKGLKITEMGEVGKVMGVWGGEVNCSRGWVGG